MPGYIAAAGLLVLLCVVVLATVMYVKFTTSYRSLGSGVGSDRESNPLNINNQSPYRYTKSSHNMAFHSIIRSG